MLKKITKWETEDGKVFDTQEEAEEYMFEQDKIAEEGMDFSCEFAPPNSLPTFDEMWREALASIPAALDTQKPVFVLGSAPNALIPPDIDRYFVIAANGAIAAFPGLVPDVLILNGWTLVDASGVGPETRAQLHGRRVKKMIVIDNLKPSDKSTAGRVLELGIQYERIEFWSKVERAETCSNASDIRYAGLTGNDIPSTGVTAICYAVSLSDDVTVSGISIESDGHSYSARNYKRGHIEVDSRTIKVIAGKFKTFAVAPQSPAQEK